MAGRHQSDRVVALLERPVFGWGCLLDGQLGQRVGLQPLVGDRLAAADRAAVAAGGQPGLGPPQRRPPGLQELVDGQAGLFGVAPVGVVDVIAQLGPAAVGRSPPGAAAGVGLARRRAALAPGSGPSMPPRIRVKGSFASSPTTTKACRGRGSTDRW
jgi:hypothetical protein